MPATVPAHQAATPRERLADVCGKQIKATLDPHRSATALRSDAAEAIRQVTTQKAAAADIGINQGRLSHKLSDGSLTLAQLEALGPAYAVQFGRQLLERYGPLAASPAEHTERKLDEIQALVNEVRQFVRGQ